MLRIVERMNLFLHFEIMNLMVKYVLILLYTIKFYSFDYVICLLKYTLDFALSYLLLLINELKKNLTTCGLMLKNKSSMSKLVHLEFIKFI